MPNAGPPQPTPQQIQQQAQLEAQRREAARARSKVPTDKEIPDGVGGVIIGDAVERYRNLRQAEKNLDAVMMRKRLENQDSLPRTHQLHKTMRIWISNTTENQPWQQMTMDNEAFDFGDSSQATYKVKIEGRLLDDGDEPDADGKDDGDVAVPENGQDGEDADKKQKDLKPAGTQRTRLSHFFKQITVEFDRNSSLQPDQLAQVEWKKPEARDQRGNKQLNLADDENFDCIEFERKGDENLNVTVNLIRDDYPERYRLSPPLAELLDMVESDRGGVITGLWHYIRHNKLYEDEETRQIRCDAKLRPVRIFSSQKLFPSQLISISPQIFNADRILFYHLPDHLARHLTPLPPIKLPYTIRVDAAHQTDPKPTIYDISVLVEDPLRAHVSRVLTATTPLSQIEKLDEQIALAVQAMQASKAKHDFFEAMARDPVGFTKRWVSSQRRDLEVILGEANRGGGGGEEGLGEEWRKGGREGVWGGEKAKESVGLFLARSTKMM
jgi:SWI/SNF-related matrix-associated actin-dependent regulator of chromatin subfamily D